MKYVVRRTETSGHSTVLVSQHPIFAFEPRDRAIHFDTKDQAREAIDMAERPDDCFIVEVEEYVP